MDRFSRFTPIDPLESHPDIRKKVLRAAKSAMCKPVMLTAAEAAFLIEECGGPDPDRAVPGNMYIYNNRTLVVEAGDNPRCWRV